ncbi:MAG: hypothetical protein V5A28_07885 [Haloarculaceae archaeon]
MTRPDSTPEPSDEPTSPDDATTAGPAGRASPRDVADRIRAQQVRKRSPVARDDR